MIDGAVVIDAVAHSPNFADSNCIGRSSHELIAMIKELHLHWNPPEQRMPEEYFLVDVDVETVARTLFLESQTDIAVHHHLPLYSWFADGSVSREKNVEIARRWPHRIVSYVGVDPTQGSTACLDSMERQMAELPRAVGIKLYPHQVEPWRTYRMDDPQELFPLFERALELGIRTVAVHKAAPLGPVPMNPYRIEDVEGAAYAFPELNFEIIHTGMAFLDETAQAIARFPNVYANIETTSQLTYFAPGHFQRIIAELLFWGGREKILYSASVPYGHPRHQIESIWSLTLSDDLLEEYKLDQITREDRVAFLGGNYAQMIGLDTSESLKHIENDEFATRLRARGGELEEPWSNWRRGVEEGRFARYTGPPAGMDFPFDRRDHVLSDSWVSR